MEIKKVSSIYFSPTGGTKAVAERIASKLSGDNAENNDITVAPKDLTFGENELVLIAAPVFGGRLPAPMLGRLEKINGGGAVAVIIVVYGNRAYEDALAELYLLAEKRGFVIAAAGAFIARHSILSEFGAGRPDGTDKNKMDSFSEAVLKKLADTDSAASMGKLKLPIPNKFREFGGVAIKPSARALKCGKCGKCAKNCPVGAIPESDPTKTDDKKCISCMRCVSICPHYARSVGKVALMALNARIKKTASSPKQAETFI